MEKKKLDLVMKVTVPCKVHKFRKIQNESFNWKSPNLCIAEAYGSRRILLERILRKKIMRSHFTQSDNIIGCKRETGQGMGETGTNWQQMKIKRFLVKEVQDGGGGESISLIPRMWNQSRRKKDKDQLLPRFDIEEDDSHFFVVFKKQDSSMFQMTTIKILWYHNATFWSRAKSHSISFTFNCILKNALLLNVICFLSHLSDFLEKKRNLRRLCWVLGGKNGRIGNVHLFLEKTCITLIDMREMKSKYEKNRTLSIIWMKLMMSNNFADPRDHVWKERKLKHVPITNLYWINLRMIWVRETSRSKNYFDVNGRSYAKSNWTIFWFVTKIMGQSHNFFAATVERKYKYTTTMIITSWRLEIYTKNTDTPVSGLAIKRDTWSNNGRRSNTERKIVFPVNVEELSNSDTSLVDASLSHDSSRTSSSPTLARIDDTTSGNCRDSSKQEEYAQQSSSERPTATLSELIRGVHQKF